MSGMFDGEAGVLNIVIVSVVLTVFVALPLILIIYCFVRSMLIAAATPPPTLQVPTTQVNAVSISV